MPSQSTKIVITGIGAVSPLGMGVEALGDSFLKHRSVVRPKSIPDWAALPFHSYSAMEDFDPKKMVTPRKNIKLMCREVLSGVAAAQLAVDHAGLDTSAIDLNRFGVVLGSEMMYGDPLELSDLYHSAVQNGEFNIQRFGEHMTQDLFPLWMLKFLPNMPACHIGIAQKSCGPNNSIVQGDASSLLAMAESISLMRRGWVDVMITGGTGSNILPARAVNFSASMFSELPASHASCPFDARRDGMVCGEGAATFVLETAEHAQARGAKPLAEVVGFGRAFELATPYSPTTENGASQSAIQRSIVAAMTDAESDPGQVDHVNAHGLSSRAHDAREAQAIQSELPDVPVTAIKSYCGNLGAGSGAVELAASVLAFEQGAVAPTLNYEIADPDCPVQVIKGEHKPITKTDAVILSQSSTGQTAAVVIRKAS